MTTKSDIEYHLSILRELSATLIGRSQNRHDALEWARAALASSTQPTSAATPPPVAGDAPMYPLDEANKQYVELTSKQDGV